MTKEEALKWHRMNYQGFIETEWNGNEDSPFMEAFEMSIEALKQPEVIRCKGCKNNKGDYFCEEVMKLIHDDDYCAWAERRR